MIFSISISIIKHEVVPSFSFLSFLIMFFSSFNCKYLVKLQLVIVHVSSSTVSFLNVFDVYDFINHLYELVSTMSRLKCDQKMLQMDLTQFSVLNCSGNEELRTC